MMANVQKGDYVIVQFGHNDQKKEDSTRFSNPEDYAKHLTKYVEEIRTKGANPVLATPISRKTFDAEGNLLDTHLEYTLQVYAVSESMQVPLLELNQKSKELLSTWGSEKSKELFMHFGPGLYEKFPEGVEDNTHLSPTGAFRISDLAIEEIKMKIPELAVFLKI